MNSRWLLGLFLVIFCGAFTLRASRLDLRPMHGDEAVHAVKFNVLWSKGEYRYDPREYHGPTLYYFAVPAAKISSAQNFAELSSVTLRFVPACFGTLLVALLWLIRDGFGKNRDTVLWAAIFTAISPVMVYYSRFFIQETLLLFFTLSFIACQWRARQSVKLRAANVWIIGAGCSAGLMLASKETALIAFVCVVFAWFVTLRFPAGKVEPAALTPRGWFGMALVAIGVALCFLSNFGRSLPDIQTLSVAITTYLSRADGQESQGAMHRHSWFQYFEWLFWYRNGAGPRWSEAFTGVFAFIGLVASFRRGQHTTLARFFATYSLAMIGAYSAIPYKTPWCVLGFWQGAILLAGFGVSQTLTLPLRVFADKPRYARFMQAATLFIFCGGCWNLLQQTRLSTGQFSSDRRNPWVYAHPTRDVFRLGERVQQLAAQHPRKNALPIAVIAPRMDYWPLPWDLRAQSQVGFFDRAPDSHAVRFPLIVAAKSSLEEIQKQSKGSFERRYHIEYYGLRPANVFGLCIEKPLWQRFLQSSAATSP